MFDQVYLHTTCGCLSSQQACSTGLLNLLLSILTEELGLHDNWDLWKNTLAQNLEVTQLCDIEDWSQFSTSLGLLVDTLWQQRPQAVNIDSWAEGQVSLEVEGSHTDLNMYVSEMQLIHQHETVLFCTYLTEVTRVVLIHQDSVVVLTTGITTTTRVSTVLTDTTVTGADVTSLLSVVV